MPRKRPGFCTPRAARLFPFETCGKASAIYPKPTPHTCPSPKLIGSCRKASAVTTVEEEQEGRRPSVRQAALRGRAATQGVTLALDAPEPAELTARTV